MLLHCAGLHIQPPGVGLKVSQSAQDPGKCAGYGPFGQSLQPTVPLAATSYLS